MVKDSGSFWIIRIFQELFSFKTNKQTNQPQEQNYTSNLLYLEKTTKYLTLISSYS